jgi:hypothetical protein
VLAAYKPSSAFLNVEAKPIPRFSTSRPLYVILSAIENYRWCQLNSLRISGRVFSHGGGVEVAGMAACGYRAFFVSL